MNDRELAWAEYEKRTPKMSDAEFTAARFGFGAGYDAGRSQWVAVSERLPTDYVGKDKLFIARTPHGLYVTRYSNLAGWVSAPKTEPVVSWMPIPPYRTPEDKQS